MALVLGAFTGIVFTRKNHQNNFRITSGILAFAGSFAGVTAATLILLPFKLNTGFSELQSEIGLKIMIQSAVDTISTTDMIFITSSVLLALLLANIHYFAHLIHPKP
jgi:hypothetical protein